MENHADATAQRNDFQAWIVNGLTFNRDISFVTNTIHQIVHAIEIAEECRFTATRWTNKSDDVALRNVERHGLEGLLISVPKTEVLDTDKVWATGYISGGTGLDAGITHGVIELEGSALKAGTESIANGDSTEIQADD